MPTTRSEVMAALELAALVLPETDRAANHREEFITLIGLDPGLVGQGRGKRAAYILTAVIVALRAPAPRSRPAVAHQSDAAERGESDEETCAANVGATNNGQKANVS